MPTNEKPDNVRSAEPADGVSSLSLSLRLTLSPFLLYRATLSIDRATRRYLVLPRPIIIAHIEPDDVPAEVRLSTCVPIQQSRVLLSSVPLTLLFRTRPSREDNGGESSATKRRSFQNGRVSDASVGSPFPLCVSGNGNGLPGGDDAGGRASTAHAQSRRPGCAHGLRNNRGGPWDSGAAAAGTAAAGPPPSSSRSSDNFFFFFSYRDQIFDEDFQRDEKRRNTTGNVNVLIAARFFDRRLRMSPRGEEKREISFYCLKREMLEQTRVCYLETTS